MKRILQYIVLLFPVLLQPYIIRAQGMAIGHWRDHFPYHRYISVCEAGNLVYGATPYSLVSYDKTDHNVRRVNKINGLSDINITSMAYSEPFGTLIVTYKNTNIDLIRGYDIINIPDIKRKQILGNKTINKIKIIDNTAYLLCGFGIVLLNIEKGEITDTYYLGPDGTKINIFDIEKFNQQFFAATDDGIYTADVNNPNLSNFENWTKDISNPHPDDTFNIVTRYRNKLYFNESHSVYNTDTIFVFDGSSWSYFDKPYSYSRGSIREVYGKLLIANNGDVDIFDSTGTRYAHIYNYVPEAAQPNDAILDREGVIWIADNYCGMIRNPVPWTYQKIKFEGPATSRVFSLFSDDGTVWVTPGSFDESWAPMYAQADLYEFTGEKWTAYSTANHAFDTIFDIIGVAADKNNTSHCYASSWNYGVLELSDGVLTHIYNQYNSSLQPYGSSDYVRIAGIVTDDNNTLWVTNSNCFKGLSAKTSSGTWYSYYIGNVMELGNIIIDDYGQKWIVNRSNGITVFSDNGTLSNTTDDRFKTLSNSEGLGGLPSKNVWCLAKDREGQIWVGTDAGIAVFSSPGNVFSNRNYDAYRILVELDGFFQYLLEFETVTSIAVDGANKKWIGTQNAGVFLVSADGTKQLQHFTTENSPLLSNNINSIAINGETGEVFFGSPYGIVSFKGEATTGGDKNENVYAYPNPVRESYEGYIAIKGLVADADVKITNISGTLIFQTKAEGGQAVWNGMNFKGERAQTGVYIVFATDETGSEKAVSKILFIN